MLLIALLRLPPGGEDRLCYSLLAGLRASGLSAMWPSVLFAVLAVILCRLLLAPLQRRGLLLRVQSGPHDAGVVLACLAAFGIRRRISCQDLSCPPDHTAARVAA